MRKTYPVILLAIIILVIYTGCQKNYPMPKVEIVVGEKVECRNGQTKILSIGYGLKENDTIVIPEDCKVKLSLRSGAIYINSRTTISIGSAVKQGDVYRFTMHLLEGELFFTQQEQSMKADSYLFVLNGMTATSSVNDMNIRYIPDASELSIVSLSGSVMITSLRNEERFIAPCNHFITDGQQKSSTESINSYDIERLAGWVGKTTIDEALELSKCSVQNNVTKNYPPEWVKLPDEVYMAGKPVVYTVKAADQENTKVIYELLSGPEGMIIDKFTGEIKFTPASEGTVNVTIRATDSDKQTSVLDHVVTISADLAVILHVPKMVAPGETISVVALSPKNILKKSKEFVYRFDCDGDGVFDYPGASKFGYNSKVKRSFNKEGTYLLKVEVKNTQGKTASSSRRVIVNQKPKAAIKVNPQVGTINTDYLIDVGDCSDSRDPSESLMVRFDVDSDGKWDIPANSGFIKEKRAKYSWNKAGKFRVVVQVIDRYGLTDTASAEVTVTNGLKIDDIVCPDTVHVGDSVSIECKFTESDFAVNKFHWSFDSDTTYEVLSEKPVYNHVFKEEGAFVIRCKAVDQNGLSGTQQKRIEVINSECYVDAGGPYKAHVNKTFSAEGFAKDPDNKILKYSWDFDNDGKIDWSSEQTGKTSHVFQRSGMKKMIFIVETDDGSRVTDSAFVQVQNSPATASAGEDIVSRKGKKVQLNGTGEDPDGKIILYRWDFDNDGKIDWESDQNGAVEKEFQSYTTAVFSVIDSDSSITYDSIRIIICPEEMRTIENGKFCIDIYEYPNKKNEIPLTDVSYEQAREKCKKMGKRLCTEDQWRSACNNNEEKFNFPYGKDHIKDKCNTLGNNIVKNKISSSGYFLDCHGSKEIFDMSGNVAEWTESAKGEPFIYGGSWQSDENTSTCNSKLQLKGGRKYFYVGFRCCK